MSYESRLIRILSAVIAMLILLTLACFASSALPMNGSAHSRTRSRTRPVSRAAGFLSQSAGISLREPTQGEPQVKLLRSARTVLRLVLALVSVTESLWLSAQMPPEWLQTEVSELSPAPATDVYLNLEPAISSGKRLGLWEPEKSGNASRQQTQDIAEAMRESREHIALFEDAFGQFRSSPPQEIRNEAIAENATLLRAESLTLPGARAASLTPK